MPASSYPSSTTPTVWRHIGLLWLVGVLAAAQLGKFAALSSVIRTDLSLSLVGTGWLVSLIETGGASLGLVAGLLIGRWGSRRALIGGLSLLTVAGLAEGLSATALPLFACRIIESAGYLAIVIAAPSLIATIARPKDQAAALTLWSTFVPVGFAIGMGLSGAGLLITGWSNILLAWGLIAAMVMAGCLRTTLPEVRTPGCFVVAGRPAWLLSIGFGFYTLVFVGLLALLPVYLNERIGLTPTLAATATGIASATTLVGAAVAAVVVQREAVLGRWVAMTLGLLVPAGLSGLVFGGGAPLATIGAIFILFAISGIPSSIVFARLPRMTGRDGQPPAVAAANGVLTQFGAGGSLIGPPILAFVVDHWGWRALATAVLAGLCACLVMTIWADKLAHSNRERAQR
ncbi:CynX/NimT family MFS transporter [Asticcacaulis sp. 201]|uniref:MFS transporter n=1 Tax=Asticcacaulis sp. 201 TaxID=3028787 RepID=UPI00291704CA|nr:MFS transporter [Asticcacaulis sp. 201]MDV6331629.1 MFS transporter [Asticcacaulis sp. 201]